MFPSSKARFGENGARSDQGASSRAQEPGRASVSSIPVLSVPLHSPTGDFSGGASLTPFPPCFPTGAPSADPVKDNITSVSSACKNGAQIGTNHPICAVPALPMSESAAGRLRAATEHMEG